MVTPLLHLVNETSGWYYSIYFYFSFIGTALVILLYLWKFHKDIFHSLFPKKNGGLSGNSLNHFGIGIFLGFLLMIICCGAALIHHDIVLNFQGISFFYLLASFFMVLIQSATEEIVSRVYIQGVLANRYGILTGVLVNSLFFALIHVASEGATLLSTVTIFIIGLAFSLLVYHYKSIWLVIGFHTMWNFTQGLILGIPVSGIACTSGVFQVAKASNSLFYNLEFGLESTVTSLVLNGIVLGFVWYQMKKKKAS